MTIKPQNHDKVDLHSGEEAELQPLIWIQVVCTRFFAQGKAVKGLQGEEGLTFITQRTLYRISYSHHIFSLY